MGDLRIDAPRAAAGQLESIQLLRAVAALAVVAHHTPLFANGAWGVDLFFVVSGFIICYVTAESGSQFLRKRVIRVVPLYWLGTLGVFTLALLWPQLLNRSTASVEQLVMSLFFIPFEKGGVVQPMLFLGWTLNYEMFFYLLFALSMQISHRYRAAICAGLLLALVVIGRVVPVDGVIPRFYTSTLLLEFVFGMLCYGLYAQAAWRTSVDRSTPLRAILLVSGVGCVILLPLVQPWVDEFGPERGWAWGLPAALAFLLIVIGLSGLRMPRLAVLIGDASTPNTRSNR
jgi:exopolysaccharide production protein ExoZ